MTNFEKWENIDLKQSLTKIKQQVARALCEKAYFDNHCNFDANNSDNSRQTFELRKESIRWASKIINNLAMPFEQLGLCIQ